MRVDELIPERFRVHHHDYRQEFFAHPDARAMGAGRHLFGLRSDGTEVPIEIGLNPLETDEGTFVLAAIIDITERKRAEELLRDAEAALQEDALRREMLAEVTHLANHDHLTGLPNRTKLLNHLVDAIAPRRGRHHAPRSSYSCSTSTTSSGSTTPWGTTWVTSSCSPCRTRLQEWVRDDDLVARLGGDEFVLVFSGMPDGKALYAPHRGADAGLLAPVDVHGHELSVTVEHGSGATTPSDGTDPTDLLKNADTAMYHAKGSGRNNFQWFYEAMLDETNDKMAIAAALRQALDRDELSVVYQPQVDLGAGDGGRHGGAGAVGQPGARADRPGPVHPGRRGQRDDPSARRVGPRVRACRRRALIQAELGRPLGWRSTSRRASSTPGLVGPSSPRRWTETGFDPACLELEITEGILMDDPYDVIELLRRSGR